MTQPPLPPQMPPPEPLDESERAIARALRNLPVGAPPPELDARILGAARRAVHLSPPRKTNQRRWLVGFGTAASALLAIGLFVKTHGPGQDALYTPPAQTESEAPASAPVAAAPAAPAAPAAMKDQVEPQAAADAMAPAGNAESVQSAAPTMGAPVEAAPPKEAPERAQQATGSLSAAKSAPQAFPAIVEPSPPPPMPPPRMQAPAPMPPVVMEETAPMSAAPAPASPPSAQAVDERQERKVDQDVAARRDTAAASPAAAGGSARDQPALSKSTSNALKSTATDSDQAASDYANTPKDKSLDRVDVTGSRVRHAHDEGAVLPSIDDDARLAPAQWIERIRARVKAADGDGARESLRRYRLRYPDASIPGDLFPLLR